MIPMLLTACAILLCFAKLMTVCLSRDLCWRVPPLALLFLLSISARRRWLA